MRPHPSPCIDSLRPELTVSLEQQVTRKSEVLSPFERERREVRDRLMHFVYRFRRPSDFRLVHSAAMPYPSEAQQQELYVVAWFQRTENDGTPDHNAYFEFYTPATNTTDTRMIEELVALDGTRVLAVKAAEVKVLACSEERLGEEGRSQMQAEIDSARATLDCLDILYPKE